MISGRREETMIMKQAGNRYLLDDTNQKIFIKCFKVLNLALSFLRVRQRILVPNKKVKCNRQRKYQGHLHVLEGKVY